MVLTAVLTSVLTAIMVTAGLLLVLARAKNGISKTIHAFVGQPNPNTPSQLAVWFDQAAFILSTRLVNNLKTTVMGMSSVDTKNERKAASEATLANNPGLAAVLRFIPGAKRLMKNPELLSIAGAALSKMAGGNGSKPSQDALQSTTVQSIFPM